MKQDTKRQLLKVDKEASATRHIFQGNMKKRTEITKKMFLCHFGHEIYRFLLATKSSTRSLMIGRSRSLHRSRDS